MAGYNGYSMSNNAKEAYSNNEMPFTRWSKAEIINQATDIYHVSEDLLNKATLNDLRYYFLEKTSWHHTGEFYNKTDFYSFDTSMNESDVANYFKNYQKPKREPRIKVAKAIPTTIKAKVCFKYWSGSRKHPHCEDIEMDVEYKSSDKMVFCGNYGWKRLSSLTILKKEEK